MIKKTEHTFAILAYKESPYLEKTILSLKSQTYESYIFIATSTPCSFLETSAQKHKLGILVNQNSKGISSDWSFALNNSKTKYITLAHQDDLYLPDYTEKCLFFAERHCNNLITFTDYGELIEGKPRFLTLNLIIKHILLSPYLFKDALYSKFFKRSILSFGSPIPCPGVMYNIKNIGHFEFSENFNINLDWDAWLRLAQIKGSFVYVKKKLLIHRIHKESATTYGIKNNQRQLEDRIIFKRLWPGPLSDIFSLLYSFSYMSNC